MPAPRLERRLSAVRSNRGVRQEGLGGKCLAGTTRAAPPSVVADREFLSAASAARSRAPGSRPGRVCSSSPTRHSATRSALLRGYLASASPRRRTAHESVVSLPLFEATRWGRSPRDHPFVAPPTRTCRGSRPIPRLFAAPLDVVMTGVELGRGLRKNRSDCSARSSS